MSRLVYHGGLSSSSAGNPGIYPREGERSRFSYVKGSLREGISIPIRPLDQGAESVRNALDPTGCGLDVETPAGADGHAAEIGADFCACRHHRLH